MLTFAASPNHKDFQFIKFVQTQLRKAITAESISLFFYIVYIFPTGNMENGRQNMDNNHTFTVFFLFLKGREHAYFCCFSQS